MIEKVKEYIKNNKFYMITMVIGTLGFMILMKCIVLYSDDFYLGTISHQGFKAALEHLISNYLTWGGGPTPFIAIIFLMFRLGVWKIFNCSIIVISIILAIRMITYKNKMNKGVLAICMWILIYILNIYIANETLYWLDGNLAYVLTTFQMFIYFYYLYSRIIMKTESKKYDYIILPIFAFFAGWSGPQAGALTVILPLILFAWVKFKNKVKIKPVYIIMWIVGLIGFLVYFLAPGNSARTASDFTDFYNYNVVEKVLFRANLVWNLMFDFKNYSFASIPFYLYIVIGLMSATVINVSKEENNSKLAKIMKSLSMCIIAFLGINLIISMNCNICYNISEKLISFQPILENIKNNTFSIVMLVPYITTGLILIVGIILSYYISHKEKSPLLVITVTGAILGQIMMLVSPYSPLRTTYITVFLLWVSIIYLVSIIIKKNISIIAILTLVIAITYDIKLAIAILLIYYILINNKDKEDRKDNKIELKLIVIVFTVIAFFTYTKTLISYYENSIIYKENIDTIEKYKTDSKNDKVIYLKKPKDPIYAHEWIIVDGSEWIEDSVKSYFEIDENVELRYEEEE